MSDNQPSRLTTPLIDTSRPLTREAVGTAEGIFVLGLICARLLQTHEEAHLHIEPVSGVVEVIPRGEIELDLLDEIDAIQRLTSAGYTEKQLESFLRARDARLHRTRLEQEQKQMMKEMGNGSDL